MRSYITTIVGCFALALILFGCGSTVVEGDSDSSQAIVEEGEETGAGGGGGGNTGGGSIGGSLAAPPATNFSCDFVQAKQKLVQTARGAYVHGEHCTADNQDSHMVLFVPGSGTKPSDYQKFAACVGEVTGLCTMVVPFDNQRSILDCCYEDDTVSAAESRDCVDTVTPAKAIASPTSYTCVDGEQTTMTYYPDPSNPSHKVSLEAELSLALHSRGMCNFLEGGVCDETPLVNWSKVKSSGHSQGGVMSHYFAFTGGSLGNRALKGVGAIATGIHFLSDGTGFNYASHFNQTPVTPIELQRGFWHKDDGNNGKMTYYDAISLPLENRLIAITLEGNCSVNAHSCVAYDGNVPTKEDGVTPLFLDHWIWAIDE